LLVVVFAFHSKENFNSWKIQLQNEKITYIVINNGKIDYSAHEKNLKEIFNYMNVKEDVLLTYNDMKTTI
jgi:hypothetical protein